MRTLTDTEIQDILIDSFRNPKKTYNVGFKLFSEFYNMIEGSCTDWTGFPVSGKTELLLELLMNMHKFYGWRHLIYMPDAGSNSEVLQDLTRKYTGLTFNEYYYKNGNRYKNINKIQEKDILKYSPAISQAFAILDANKQPTPVEFWQYAEKNMKELNIKTGVIDSWNYLRHDMEGHSREDKWLEWCLSTRNQIAERSGLHFHTVIHPTKGTKNADGKIVPPTEHDMKGGSEWFNNAKSIILVNRETKDTTIADIYIKKAKPKIVGQAGIFSLEYDVKQAKYFVNNGDGKIYAKHPNDQVEPMQF